MYHVELSNGTAVDVKGFDLLMHLVASGTIGPDDRIFNIDSHMTFTARTHPDLKLSIPQNSSPFRFKTSPKLWAGFVLILLTLAAIAVIATSQKRGENDTSLTPPKFLPARMPSRVSSPSSIPKPMDSRLIGGWGNYISANRDLWITLRRDGTGQEDMRQSVDNRLEWIHRARFRWYDEGGKLHFLENRVDYPLEGKSNVRVPDNALDYELGGDGGDGDFIKINHGQMLYRNDASMFPPATPIPPYRQGTRR